MTTIKKVLVKAGTKIKKGQHVVELDDYKTNADLYKLNLLLSSFSLYSRGSNKLISLIFNSLRY